MQLILTHGAGAGMNSEFMQALIEEFEKLSVSVIPFNFSYMQQMIETGKRRPPPKIDRLEEELYEFVQLQDHSLPVFIAGKSMGARVGSMILERTQAIAAICFGYPFHPINKPETLRTHHLETITKPVLILQGTRDRLGNQREIMNYQISSHVSVEWLEGADHDFKGGGISSRHRIESAAQFAFQFMQTQL